MKQKKQKIDKISETKSQFFEINEVDKALANQRHNHKSAQYNETTRTPAFQPEGEKGRLREIKYQEYHRGGTGRRQLHKVSYELHGS